MDDRLRRLERRWRSEPSDIAAHAAYLAALVRLGEISPANILAVALWGHEPARQMLGATIVKLDAIIIGEKRVPTVELRDIINSSRLLSREATTRIALGVMLKAHEALVDIEKTSRRPHRIVQERLGEPLFDDGHSPMNVDLGTAIVYAEAYVTGNSTDRELWKAMRRVRVGDLIIVPGRQGGRLRRASLERLIYNGCIDIATKSKCDKIPLAAVAWLSDEEIFSGVRKELYTWALGDAR